MKKKKSDPMSKMDLLKIIAKNAVTVATDSISTATLTGDGSYAISNLASAGLKSWSEIKDFTKQSNDALYSLQVETFLHTADLNKEQVEDFLNENTDNLRLGMETLKILEKTHLEKQAELMGIAFKKYVKGEISKKEYNLFTHIIEKLNRYILEALERDAGFLNSRLKLEEKLKESGKINIDSRLQNGFCALQHGSRLELLSLGFMEEVSRNKEITERDLKRATDHRQPIRIERETFFKRTPIYMSFCINILLETICTT